MAAQLLKLAGNRLPYIVLLKWMYLADRKMLLSYGEPISFDKWVSMAKGPLLSKTLALIRHPELSDYWTRHIMTSGYDVVLTANPGNDSLSELSEEVLQSIFSEFHDPSGKYDNTFTWNLVKYMHELPEWDKEREYDHGVSDIPYDRVLMLEGVPRDVAADIMDSLAGYELPELILEEEYR